ncbi:MAG: hypothetical protein E7C85_04900, partial [Anaerococcus prevotii]|nr:hypothetical protein [Anaerococcus prevotii]
KDKFTVFIREDDFDMSEQSGIFRTSSGKYKIRLENKNVIEADPSDERISEDYKKIIKALEERYSYYL